MKVITIYDSVYERVLGVASTKKRAYKIVKELIEKGETISCNRVEDLCYQEFKIDIAEYMGW